MKLLFFYLSLIIFPLDDCRDLVSKFSHRFPLSFYIYDIKAKRVVKDCNSDLLLIPGSTLKIITSIYSFEKLGSDFRFKTEFFINGKKEDYVDAFIIRSYGNFTLGSENFNSSIEEVSNYILDLIKKNGIKKIERLYIENPYIKFPHGSIEWQDIGNYYSTSVSFFSINDNSYKLYFKTNDKGSKSILLKVVPDVGLSFTNLVYAAESNSGDNSYIYSTPYSTNAVIIGTLPSNKEEFVIKGSIFKPDAFFSNYLCDYLRSRDIYVDLCISTFSIVDSYEEISIGFLVSPTLAEIIKLMNKKSFNFYADSLLHFALIKEGKIGLDYNLSELSNFLAKRSIKEFRIVDGSGLSRRNLFSSKSFVKLLNYAYNKEYFNDFYSSLVGKNDKQATGYIKSFDIKNFDEFKIKSGSLNSVRSYCGYLKKGNKIYSFSFIFNNYLESPLYLQRIVEEYLSNLK